MQLLLTNSLLGAPEKQNDWWNNEGLHRLFEVREEETSSGAQT